MSEEHLVVIGSGPAGNSAAFTLKQMDPGVRVTLISKERDGCYRPHRLPAYIAGTASATDLFVTSPGSYGKRGIKYRSCQRVVHVDPEKRHIVLDHKEILPYTGLILAVGGVPRIPEPLLAFKDYLFTLKTLDDARKWMEKLTEVRTLLMIGGDLTSLSMTRALLHLGKEVIFMLNEDAFWPLRFNDALFQEVAQALEEKGVWVLRCRKVKSLAPLSEGSLQVQMDNQSVLVEMVGAFFGLSPDIAFLARSGIPVDRGVLVDEYLSTPFEGVFAAGDCAQIYQPEIRDYWVSIGHDNAVELGRIAAMNLLGSRVEAQVATESIFNGDGIRVNTSWWAEF
jgi:NAD(P)H-nitrite reductase large subunit